MKLLFITQYFPPEVGAPQNRLYELAIRLQKAGVDVSVLTAMPNYPKMVVHDEYRGKKYVYEEMQGLKIHRSWIYVSTDRSIIKRLLNYFSFVYSSYFTGLRHIETSDFIFCESPPLFLGITAYLLAWHKNAKLIFNVSDLWPESAEKLGLVTNNAILLAATWLEEFLYRKSALITGQTQGIVANIKSRFPQKNVHWLPNGVDLDYYNPDNYDANWRAKNGFAKDDLVFLYAGILGHAQGLEIILKAADRLRERRNIQFVLIGDGPERASLTAKAKELGLENVRFFAPVPKKEMPDIVRACTATIIPLKRLELFKGAIPSKIFESLAMKKPILLGVDGEAKELFITQGKSGLYFTPESVEELAEAVAYVAGHPEKARQLGENARKYVGDKFNRNRIASEFHALLIAAGTNYE